MEAGEHSSVSTDLLQRPLMTIQDREGADPFSLRGNLEEAGDECGLTSDVAPIRAAAMTPWRTALASASQFLRCRAISLAAGQCDNAVSGIADFLHPLGYRAAGRTASGGVRVNSRLSRLC